MTMSSRILSPTVAAVLAGGLALTLAGAAKPAKPRPAAPVRRPTRWVDAAAGDYARYKVTGWKNVIHSYRVESADKKHVNLKLELMVGGKRIWGREQTIKKPRYVDPNKPPAWSAREEKDLGSEILELPGAMLTCKITQIKMTVGQKTFTNKVWTCKKVPGHLVREMSDAMGKMQIMQELVSFKRRK